MVLNQLGRPNCNNMAKYIVYVFMLCLVGTAYAVPARVGYIIDGDTFSGQVMLADSDTEISVRVRLRNVDTPEIHGACEGEVRRAQYAKQRLGELIPVGTVVELQNIKDDKYLGRIDANVFDSAGRDVGNVLVSENVGRAYSGGKRRGWCDGN